MDMLKGPLGEAIIREWQSIDVGEPEMAWAAVVERFRMEARNDQACADSRRRDAKDAAEQAALHQARADDFRSMADAIERAPIMFPDRAMLNAAAK